MIGDGYTVVRHCEFADVPAGVEPDAEPVYCTDDDLHPSLQDSFTSANAYARPSNTAFDWKRKQAHSACQIK